MPIIRHDIKDINRLESIITKDNGTPLYGEIDMYRRIYSDCEKSEYTWHFWHDLRLPVSVKNQKEIQIDFLLVCEKGLIIIEVKGGKIGIEQGLFYYEEARERTYMGRSPFDQARDYMYALMNNKIVSSSQLFLDTICAFPHTQMYSTNANPNADLGYKLWSKKLHEDTSNSFADFCIGVIDRDKQKNGWNRQNLSPQEIEVAIHTLLFSFEDRTRNVYSERSLESILQRLQIDNLSTFNSLQKNDRIFIEGGPGTGKTTIAKAYIEKYHTLRGLYLCWNRLLESKIKHQLWQDGLVYCEVNQFASYILSAQKAMNLQIVDAKEIIDGSIDDKLCDLFSLYRKRPDFIPYDYIIIDEAQDVLDKGALVPLNYLTSITQDGISSGRYLVFFDTEQGYNSKNRQIDDIANSLAQNGARFVLDVNKRVPTNKEIVSFANCLLDGDDVNCLFDKITHENYESVKLIYFDGAKSLIRHINSIKKDIRDNQKRWGDYVVLADSSTKYQQSSGTEMLYDRIATIDGIRELTPENICTDTDELSITSILSYKGLECKHVILIINNRIEVDTFELYIGMTRAIIDLQILVLQ